MKSAAIIFLTVILFISCKSENDFGDIYVNNIMQSNTVETYSAGCERLEMMKELAEDKTSGIDFYSKMKVLYTYFQKLDSVSGNLVLQIDSIKLEMFQSFGEELSVKKEESILYYDYGFEDKNRIISFNLNKVKYVGGSNILLHESAQKIKNEYRIFRRRICELIEESVFTDKGIPRYFFKDPKINSFIGEEDFQMKFDKALKESNVAQDDRESIRMIYRQLTIKDQEFDALFTEKENWFDAFSVLLSLQNEILKARHMAFRLMSSRMCRGEYGFTNIIPVVNGPNAAFLGDTVLLEIFYGAINIYNQPDVKVFDYGKVIKIKDGRAYVQVIIPKTGLRQIRGNITVKNKSGIPKTENWEKRIKILSN